MFRYVCRPGDMFKPEIYKTTKHKICRTTQKICVTSYPNNFMYLHVFGSSMLDFFRKYAKVCMT